MPTWKNLLSHRHVTAPQMYDKRRLSTGGDRVKPPVLFRQGVAQRILRRSLHNSGLAANRPCDETTPRDTQPDFYQCRNGSLCARTDLLQSHCNQPADFFVFVLQHGYKCFLVPRIHPDHRAFTTAVLTAATKMRLPITVPIPRTPN